MSKKNMSESRSSSIFASPVANRTFCAVALGALLMSPGFAASTSAQPLRISAQQSFGSAAPGASGRVILVADDELKSARGAVAGLDGLHLREGDADDWSWSGGIGGNVRNGSNSSAVAGGLQYGITDDLGVYGKASRSLNGNSGTYAIGIGGTFR